MEFICRELAEIEEEKRAEELSDNFDNFDNLDNLDNFDEALQISPAPTSNDKIPLAGNSFHHSVGNANAASRKNGEAEKPRAKEREALNGRNKLGTVFSERIIVSPVPYIATTRESFSTLRRTPIQDVGEDRNTSLSGTYI